MKKKCLFSLKKMFLLGAIVFFIIPLHARATPCCVQYNPVQMNITLCRVVDLNERCGTAGDPRYQGPPEWPISCESISQSSGGTLHATFGDVTGGSELCTRALEAANIQVGEPQQQPILPRLNVQIPGLQPFTAPLEKVVGDKRILEIDFISQYIAALYRYLIGIVGIAAGVMIVWAGIKWLTAGGMPDRIGSAKKQIAGAVMGVIVALGAYTILFVVNPELVRLKPLHVEIVERSELIQADHTHDEPPLEAPSDIPIQRGQFNSNKILAEQNRTVSVNFSLFGKIDALSFGKRELTDISLIVIHNGGYTAAGNNQIWLDNFLKKDKNVGAHYTIQRDGTIFQHLGEELLIGHAPNGNKTGIGIELNIDKYRGNSCNSLTGSLATVDSITQACTPTADQYAALNALIDDIIARTGAQRNSEQIVGHCELVPLSGHGDPRSFDWSKIGLDNDLKKQKSRGHPCSWYVPFN